ncbi:MAG TPA: AAA family ATPase [Solirubrobacteraceae bacterium]
MIAESESRIELCGRLAVVWRGERLDDAFTRRQSRLLFAFLVLHRRRPVRRDELVGAVWPGEGAPARADELLSPLLSRLRKALGADALEGRRDLTLRLPEGTVVDWEEVGAAIDAARAAAGRSAWGACLEAAGRAEEIAARGLLPGDEAPWIAERRAELAELRVEALELAAQAGAALGGEAASEAVAAARTAVELAPFRESCWARLIEALRAEGNPAEALRAFDDLRELLGEELGASPSWEVVALREALLREVGGSPLPAAAPPLRATLGPELVERERELDALDALEPGRVALIEGPAGLGKTRLLDEARRRATAAGARVLNARASEHERDFPFGVVRQLLEVELADPARRDAVLAGAAAPASAVFGRPGEGELAADTSFAVLHGLYWSIVHLSADRPLVLAVDDVHWCDRPSLRLLAYLVRRLEGLPVLVLATLRSGEQPTDAALLDEVVHDPATVAIRPAPLSDAAAADVVRARLGAAAGDAFCAACHATTGGNPLLLHQLLAALESEGVEPRDEHAVRVEEIGPRALSRTIGLRLARMPDEAVAAARALSILGEGAGLSAVAELAGLELGAAGRAVAALSRAEILRGDAIPSRDAARAAPLRFVHPLVRDAVYYGVSVGERELQHARAAKVLAAAGAEPEQIALQLAKAPPGGDADAAATLRRAGSGAARKGAPDSAAAFLRRALAEPPPEEERAGVLLELGLAEQLVDGASAAEHLAAAYEALTDPAARAAAALALASTLFFAGTPTELLAFVRTARRETPADQRDAMLGLEAYELMTLIRGGVGEPAQIAERLARYEQDGLPEGDGPGVRMLESIVAWGWAFAGREAGPCAELALRSLSGGTLAEVDDGLLLPGTFITLTTADRPEALREWDAVLDAAYRRGSLLLTSTAHIWRGYELLARGDLEDAERSLRESLNELALWGSGGVISVFPIALLASTLVERGDVEAAREVARTAQQAPEGSQGHLLLLCAETERALAEDRPHDALATAERIAQLAGTEGNPAWIPVNDLLARALAGVAARDAARTGERAGRAASRDGFEAARAAALRGLSLAEAWGAPAAVGRALRTLGEIDGDIALLERAVETLERSRSRLERAKALAALGAAQADARDVDAAPRTLGAALTLAGICGAQGLAARCARQLAAVGAAPAAADELTEPERRVASLADDGLDARAIAERLRLTPGEAASYLRSARRKLAGALSPC